MKKRKYNIVILAACLSIAASLSAKVVTMAATTAAATAEEEQSQTGTGQTTADNSDGEEDNNDVELSDKQFSKKMKKKGFMLPIFSMMRGEKVNLTNQFRKKTGKLKWTSSNKKVAKVNKNGVVTACKKGTATITAKSGNKEYQCRLTVKKRVKSIIYLTFDDGPSRSSTPKILKILKKNKVKATFFELKPAKADYDLTRRIIKEGHALAIHGYSHDYAAIYRNETTYRNNLDKLQKLFYNKFGEWCTITRFPGGSSNTVSRHYNTGIMSRLVKKLPMWGYTYFDWNVSSSDAGGAKNSNQVFKSIKSGLQKGRGNVVLMHDFANNYKTIGALQRVIRYGKNHGYKFRTITPATEAVHHGVNN